jgi:hypothetical protein
VQDASGCGVLWVTGVVPRDWVADFVRAGAKDCTPAGAIDDSRAGFEKRTPTAEPWALAMQWSRLTEGARLKVLYC